MKLTRTLIKLPTNEYAVIPFCDNYKKLSKEFGFQVTPMHLIHGTFVSISRIVAHLHSCGINVFQYDF